MRTVNKVILVGNVGSDPKVHITRAGVKVARFNLATSSHTEREDPEERTDWHRVTLWGRLAQIAEDRITKGDKVYIEGYIQYDCYERDGVTIPTTEIRGRELVLLKRNNPHHGNQRPRTGTPQAQHSPLMSTNTHYLEGLACPKCGANKRLLITGRTVFRVLDYCRTAYESPEYDSNSPTACGDMNCDFAGDLGDFRKENQ